MARARAKRLILAGYRVIMIGIGNGADPGSQSLKKISHMTDMGESKLRKKDLKRAIYV